MVKKKVDPRTDRPQIESLSSLSSDSDEIENNKKKVNLFDQILKPKTIVSKKNNVRGTKQQVNKILTRHGFGNVDKTSKSRGN